MLSSTLRRPSLALSVRPDRSRVVVTVGGEIDVATIDDLDAAVRELRGVSWMEIVLDLHRVEVIGSTGLAWLVRTSRAARAEGWTMVLVDGSPAVTRLLALTGVPRDLFDWTGSV
ncbi:STAS domain-containing protein [Solirubrobacter sp. CPCC 204708]|uniref:Anti-sigma factor antagonist n=1 Tax=Solirubrobacter deserti TaxID=2282478 RepID=A0ABT4RJB3_9ACTN|nr:STAS domain-containing protein [Solirubrobacter deserti]MBE2317640.1 STAS domain-containing protein [Solirubrobacter deserti]MDA0138590.1 STAS domain-containing protein [Solirubrobacter deserti]